MRSVLALTLAFCTTAVAAPVPKALKQTTLNVVIDADGGVTVRGVPLKLDGKCDQLHDLLGKPDRTRSGSDVRHTWDQSGVTTLYDTNS